MQKKLKLFIFFILLLIVLQTSLVSAWWVVDWSKISWWSSITDASYNWTTWWDAVEKINNWWWSILHITKVILSWVMLFYLVYLGFMMVMAMWADDKLSTTKKQIYYVLISFLFINVPWELYNVFTGKVNNDITSHNDYQPVANTGNWNMFVNFFNWWTTVEDWVIAFIRVLIIWLVILQFMMAWISLISSAWNEDKLKKARTRFLNWIYWLIFVWIIQAWVVVAYSWNIPKWQQIFAQILNLWMFFAWPTAIFFLILGGFHYITSAWDEAKTKKWIAIIKNTVIASVILLASYAFLKDLADFTLN